MKMKILVLNGPNLNMLGERDKDHYGTLTLDSLSRAIKKEFPKDIFEFYQSNHEGELVEHIQKAANYFDGVLINPGGYAHTSVAIRDALEICKLPKIEVHLSNVSAREDFRQTLITASKCDGYISGFKLESYIAGVYLLKRIGKRDD